MNNQFLLFAGQDWYPNAGWKDFIGAFDSKESAISKGTELVATTRRTWWQVVDLSTLSSIAEDGEPFETDNSGVISNSPKKIYEVEKDMWSDNQDLWEAK